MSPNLVVLEVPDEVTLAGYHTTLVGVGAVVVLFTEPDLDGEGTAVAVAPHPHARRVVSSLPLAGREVICG